MANFTPEILEITSVNKGNKFNNGDSFSAKDLNAIVQGILYHNFFGGGGSSSVITDKTLTIPDAPADAQIVGQKIAELKTLFGGLIVRGDLL